MHHIVQPRGPGTAYAFKMRRPEALEGKIDPETDKAFAAYIKRRLGKEKHLPTAKKLRDLRLAEVRAMEADARRREAPGDRFSLETAAMWDEAFRTQNAQGGPDAHEPYVGDLIEDEVSKAPEEKRQAFRRVATTGTIRLTEAVSRYVKHRRPGNGHGADPLKEGAVQALHVAAGYLTRFMAGEKGIEADAVFLSDVDLDIVDRFRGDYLPAQTSPRSPNGLGLGTIEKHVSFLRGIWS